MGAAINIALLTVHLFLLGIAPVHAGNHTESPDSTENQTIAPYQEENSPSWLESCLTPTTDGAAVSAANCSGRPLTGDDVGDDLTRGRLRPAYERSDRKQMYIMLGKQIFAYGAPIIAGIGFLGNAASLGVMLSPRIRGLSTSVYLSVLALADTQALLNLLLTQWVPSVGLTRVEFTSEVLCYMMMAWQRFSMVLPAWTVVCVSVERFLVTWLPFRGPLVCTRRNAMIVMAMTTLLALVYGGAVAFRKLSFVGSCLDLTSVKENRWVFSILYMFIPSALLVLFNVSTALKLTYSQVKGVASESDTGKKSRKATKMVLIVAAVYITLTLPGTVFLPLRTEINLSSNGPLPDFFPFLSTVSFLGFIANHSVNFFLYVMVSEKLRKTFLGAFGFKRNGAMRKMEDNKLPGKAENSPGACAEKPAGEEYEKIGG